MIITGTFKELVEILDLESPSQDFVEGFEILARKFYQHRMAHKGFVPLSVFPSCVAIGGTYYCVEVVVAMEMNGEYRFLLKPRDPEKEHGWENMLHIVGRTVRITDSLETIMDGLSEEIFGQPKGINWSDLQEIGTVLYDEAMDGKGQRLALAPTTIYLLTIDETQIAELTDGWVEVKNLDNQMIIPGHACTLKWILEGHGRTPMMRIEHG